MNHEYSLALLEKLWMKLLLHRRKAFFLAVKALQLPITKHILSTIISQVLVDINKLNLLIALKMVWTGFICLREITYTEFEKHHTSFKDLNLMRFDITFSENDQYAIKRFKWSKTNTTYINVLIMLAATSFTSCLIKLLALFPLMTPSQLLLHSLHIIISHLPDAT